MLSHFARHSISNVNQPGKNPSSQFIRAHLAEVGVVDASWRIVPFASMSAMDRVVLLTFPALASRSPWSYRRIFHSGFPISWSCMKVHHCQDVKYIVIISIDESEGSDPFGGVQSGGVAFSHGDPMDAQSTRTPIREARALQSERLVHSSPRGLCTPVPEARALQSPSLVHSSPRGSMGSPHGKKSFRPTLSRPWGMQPNTSPAPILPFSLSSRLCILYHFPCRRRRQKVYIPKQIVYLRRDP